MDDIYGDLENYNDVNAIDELRHENKELKFKLEEYASARDKLQKDFDKLSSDFKTMEINFSSLLKTARAEIERKTQIITNLNTEKDMLVLHTIQNSNKNLNILRRNIVRDRSNNLQSRRDEVDCGKIGKKELMNLKKYDTERDRKDESSLPSIDTASSGNTDDVRQTASVENEIEKSDSYCKGESKENIAKGKKEKAQSIKNRRKSMPVLSKQYVKFSSDEEDCLPEYGNKRERSKRDDKIRKTFDRHKQSHIISETSGIDEKYSSYHESSRETYYKEKSHRYSDKYRDPRNRNDSQKQKRHFTPDKSYCGKRDYREDQTQEFGRHRILESPPLEKSNSSRWYRERRLNYEREESDEKRPKERQEKSAKHLERTDFYEPKCKRARTKSYSKPAEENIRWPKDIPPVEDKVMPEFAVHLQPTSCQSPDHSHVELVTSTASTEPKVIMNTAASKLEDPRFSSTKYVKTLDGDKIRLVTVTGRNVGLNVIDTSTWGIGRVVVPEALKRAPQIRNKYLQKQYVGIDDPVSNMSVESREIQSESNDIPMTDYVTASFFIDYEIERMNQENIKLDKVFFEKEQITKPAIAQDQEVKNVNVEFERKLAPVRYKIPRVQPKHDSAPNPLGILLEELKTRCGVDTNRKQETKRDIDEMFGTDDENTDKAAKKLSTDNVTTDKAAKRFSTGDVTVEKTAQKFSTDNVTTDKAAKRFSTDDVTTTEKTAKKFSTDNVMTDKAAKKFSTDGVTTVKADKKFSTKNITSEKAAKKFTNDNVTTDKAANDKANETKTAHNFEIQRKLSTREIIEKDLDLSDDNSDNLFIQMPAKKETVHENDKNKNVAKSKDKCNDKKPKKSEATKEAQLIETTAPSNEITSDTKSCKKTKKKTLKPKSTNPQKITTKTSSEKKTTALKVIETKVEVKSLKFNELFGDSCSLITPEDLGVTVAPSRADITNKYVHIFEDAQDSADVEAQIMEEQIKPGDPKFQEPILTSKICKKSLDKEDRPIIENTQSIKIQTSNSQLCKINKVRTENTQENNTIPTSVQKAIVNVEITNATETKAPDVLRTVIISTGVQPRVEDTKKDSDHLINDDVYAPLIQQLKIPDVPTVLATSTPHKRLIQKETEVESSCNSSEVEDQKYDSSSCNQSLLSNVEPQTEADVPDIRIFVRRRRKIKK